MKLAELKGERAIEVIADLIAPVVNIAQDQKNLKLFQNTKREGESDNELGARELKEKLPILLKTHKKDVLEILCVVNNKNPDDLSMVDIIKGAVELVNDQDFMSLFLSAVNEADKTSPTGSSANAEISEPEQ